MFAIASCREDSPTEPSADTKPALSAAAAATYTVRDLGTLGGGRSTAADINSSNVVVGSSSTGTALHAFRWRNGVMTDLGTLGGPNSAATAINNEGVIVGWSNTTFGQDRAVRWVNGVIRNLGTLGGHSQANDVNSSGWVVGWSITRSGERHAFLWRNGVMTDLGTLGGSISEATGITSTGVVVGYSTKLPGIGAKRYPFRWQNGVMRALPVMRGNTVANGVAGSRVVGTGVPDDLGEVSHAVLWTNGVMTDLGRFGGIFARAHDVNLDGMVVGHVDDSSPDCADGDAYVWHQGSVTFLPKVGGAVWAGATAINGAGHVVGFSETDIGRGDCDQTGEIHAALWTRN
jgi:probable HAF family extracellular repeat protein